ncbi:hypothetical protein BaRGS_00035231, partial [Batillaria attramentaria]
MAKSKSAIFEFPAVKESAITAQESENVTLSFTLNKPNCVDDDFEDFNIEITKVGKDSNPATYCSIRHKNGTCTNADRGCTCPGDDGSYQWTKTVDRKDNAKWVWHTSNKMTTKEEVLINVLCLHVLENIQKNLTVMAGQSENITVGVQSHAQLESTFCKQDSGEKTCSRFTVSVTGTPPNLTVAVWLNNVTKNDRGRWYLKMSNNALTRSLFFNLEVTEHNASITDLLLLNSSHLPADLIDVAPPKMKIKTPEIEFVPGADVKIEIDVCTHTKDLLNCQLTMLPDSEKTRTCVFGNDSSNRVEFHSSQHQVNRDIVEDLNHSASMSEVSSAALIGEYAEPENAPAYAVSKPLDSIGTPPSYSEVADKLTISKQLRPGAVFEFPTIKNGTISAQEHTKLAFLFELQNDHCGEELLSNFSVVVRKLTNDKTMFSTHCSMKHINGACIKALNTNPGCICLTKTGQHLFQKIVDRNDSTTWVWSTSGNLAEKKEVSFNIE